jgi:4-hydroxybenzoate polyprenyltransferase
MAVALLLGTVVLLPVPFVYGFGGLYLIVGTAAAGLLLSSAWNLYGYDHADYPRASSLLKFAMVFGLAALLVAHVDG